MPDGYDPYGGYGLEPGADSALGTGLDNLPGLLPGEAIKGSTYAAVWLAVGSLLCIGIGPFMCYMPYFAALPLSAVGLWQAFKVIQTPVGDDTGRALRNVTYAGLAGSMIAFLLSLFICFVLALVILLYVAIFAFAIVGAAAGA